MAKSGRVLGTVSKLVGGGWPLSVRCFGGQEEMLLKRPSLLDLVLAAELGAEHGFSVNRLAWLTHGAVGAICQIYHASDRVSASSCSSGQGGTKRLGSLRGRSDHELRHLYLQVNRA
jgi:hypothetical protein